MSDGRYKLVLKPKRASLHHFLADPWEGEDISTSNPDVMQDFKSLLDRETSKPAA